MKRAIRRLAKRAAVSIHRLGTRLGVHVLPVHYHSPVPDILELRNTRAVWTRKSELPGLGIDLDEQAENLRTICAPYRSEYEGNRAFTYAVHHAFGPGYGYIEAQALHGVIRHFKPKRIVEVGSGVSTHCMIDALEANKNDSGIDYSITCIEPYPSPRLRRMRQIVLIDKPVQEVPFEGVFSRLGEDDLLFIDSSHTVKPGGDVNYLVLEILPRLGRGVIVHFHDIFLPYDYRPDVLDTFLHWTETSLLRAFLIHNPRVRILFCQSHLHYERPDVFESVFPEYKPRPPYTAGLREDGRDALDGEDGLHFPTSIYLRIQ